MATLLIRYTLDDPTRPGDRQERRLVTSLLDPLHVPAEEVIVAYDGNWEIELTADEFVSHQRPVLPLRSKRPGAVCRNSTRC